MKKLILGMVFVFATGTMMNANTATGIEKPNDCFEDAWEFGEEEGGGDETQEWYWMNKYYTMWCE
ncbi:hypothetical protein [Polaribacter ponticola]|uniref:Uncharacterized protein n=1 Tax=Polaribacter ponticola TaxID=2978475 RepID=A0ABT5SBX8_9FLAO|nr:hypothetical protein [Polaribacter sp. MSW5]MDD7915627.1 hypothetical protein [Polaribacter sp. MSW5]